jgi:hypothetical protein
MELRAALPVSRGKAAAEDAHMPCFIADKAFSGHWPVARV